MATIVIALTDKGTIMGSENSVLRRIGGYPKAIIAPIKSDVGDMMFRCAQLGLDVRTYLSGRI